MLKTRDFSVKGCNNFLSIHVADTLNHTAPSLLILNAGENKSLSFHGYQEKINLPISRFFVHLTHRTFQ